MFTFVLKRLGLVVPTFLGITLLVFSLIRLIPGDPVEALSGERGMTPERYQRLIHEFGLDRPLPVQYVEYVWKALHGDLGLSAITHEPVFSEFMARFPATVELSLVAMLFASSVAIRVLGRAGQDRKLLANIAKGAIEAARRCFAE